MKRVLSAFVHGLARLVVGRELRVGVDRLCLYQCDAHEHVYSPDVSENKRVDSGVINTFGDCLGVGTYAPYQDKKDRHNRGNHGQAHVVSFHFYV